MKLNKAGADDPGHKRLLRFFDHLVASVSAARHQERASRRLSMKLDNSESPATEGRQFRTAFEMVERKRAELLSGRDGIRKKVTR